jgi:cytochrome c oxidase subunit 2
MSDWYMKRQLQHFQQGLRGNHPQDFNGAQMAVMAKLLDGEQAINDVLDHIDTL